MNLTVLNPGAMFLYRLIINLQRVMHRQSSFLPKQCVSQDNNFKMMMNITERTT